MNKVLLLPLSILLSACATSGDTAYIQQRTALINKVGDDVKSCTTKASGLKYDCMAGKGYKNTGPGTFSKALTTEEVAAIRAKSNTLKVSASSDYQGPNGSYRGNTSVGF